jgi:hypothetical protein
LTRLKTGRLQGVHFYYGFPKRWIVEHAGSAEPHVKQKVMRAFTKKRAIETHTAVTPMGGMSINQPEGVRELPTD